MVRWTSMEVHTMKHPSNHWSNYEISICHIHLSYPSVIANSDYNQSLGYQILRTQMAICLGRRCGIMKFHTQIRSSDFDRMLLRSWWNVLGSTGDCTWISWDWNVSIEHVTLKSLKHQKWSKRDLHIYIYVCAIYLSYTYEISGIDINLDFMTDLPSKNCI